MPRRYQRVEVQAYGRRFFLKAGGGVVLATVLPACSAPSGPQPGDVAPPTQDAAADSHADAGQADVRADAVIEADSGGPVEEVETSPPCSDWAPDPLGEGADAQPFESGEPPDGWGDEIPPLSDNGGFYVTTYFGIAHVDPCTWRLECSIRGEPVATLDLATLYALDTQDREHTLQCIESRPNLMKMDNALWTGRPLTEVLDLLGVTLDPSLTGVRFLCADGYEVGLPVEELDAPVWLAWLMNGEPLPPEHGFPLRTLCPGRYGWQNAKQLLGIDFIEGDPVPGYQKAWDTHYRLQALIAHPETLSLTPAGDAVRLLGKAFAGSDPVVWVGVSVDGGETFESAELTYSPGGDRWTLWRFVWTPPEPGEYALVCRARAASGLETTDAHAMAFPYDGGMTIMLKVS